MLTLKTSVATSILISAIAVTAGATYLATKATMQVSVSCPPMAASAPSPAKPNLPQGAPVPLNQGKTY